MAVLRFLANMNISPLTVEDLKQKGWDIFRVSQKLPVNASDEEILNLARTDGRAVITQDLDFSSLVALSGLNRPSLITLRLSASDPDTVTRRLLEIISQIGQLLEKGCAVTIEDTAVRIRNLPIE